MSASKSKKRTISYVLNPTNDDREGYHSLGVNSLVYDKKTDTLISGGRDGLVSMYSPNAAINTDQQYTENDTQSVTRSASEIKREIQQNLNNEGNIVSLESRIREGLTSELVTTVSYKPKAFSQSHLDWITDLQLLKNSPTVASCSNDLSVKLWNFQNNSVATLGWHNDYVKCLSESNGELVSGGLDKVINVWDTNKLKNISNYTFNQERGSVYSISSHNNLIISGGPTHTITLFDKRAMTKPIKSFVGHTGNIKCLCLKDNAFLSGSSDSTIKLWDMKTNRILRNFDIHNSAVWSLNVPEENNGFDVFYSGEKSGLVLKTDLRSSDLEGSVSATEDYLNSKLNESLGISTVVADLNSPSFKELGLEQSTSELPSSGVLSIAEGNNSIWTSTSGACNQFISNWSVPNTDDLLVYQGIKLHRNLSMLNINSRNSLEPTTGDDFDIVSQFSSDNLDHIEEALTAQINLHRPTFDLGFSSNQSCVAADTRELGGEEVQEEEPFETYFLNLSGGPSSEFVLDSSWDADDRETNDERPLLTKNNDYGRRRLEILFEKVPESSIGLTPFNSSPLETIQGSTGLIKSRFLNNRRHVMTMDESGCIYIIDILNCSLVEKLDSHVTQRRNSGIDINDTFDEFANKFQTEESLPMWCTVQTKAGKLIITLQEANFVACEIYSDDFYESYPELLLESGREADDHTRLNLGKIVLHSLLAGFVEGEKKQSRQKTPRPSVSMSSMKRSTTNNSSILSKVINKEHLASLASVNDSVGERKTSNENDKEKPKLKLFGRNKSSPAPPTSSSGSAPSSAAEEVEKPLTDDEIIDTVSDSGDLLALIDNCRLKLKIDETVPKMKIKKDVNIIINENIKHYGNDTKALYHISFFDVGNRLQELEDFLPVWVLKALLFGKYPVKESPKVGFLLVPDAASLGAYQVETDASKLNATGMLRISKIIGFTLDKLPKELQNRKIEVLCRGQVLSEKMTLMTVKTRIWKSSGDVELCFRLANE